MTGVFKPFPQGEDAEMSFLDSFLTFNSTSTPTTTSRRPLPGKPKADQEEQELYKKGWRRRLQRLTSKQPNERGPTKEESRVLRRLASLGNLAEEKTNDKVDQSISWKQEKKLRKLASMGSLAPGAPESVSTLGREIRRRLASSRDRLHSVIK